MEGFDLVFTQNPEILWVALAAIVSFPVLLLLNRGRRSRSKPDAIARTKDSKVAHTGVHETQLELVTKRPLQTTEDAHVPLDDVPSDVDARETGSAPTTPAARPHTVDEIQRHEPKALSSALANTTAKSIFYPSVG
ncbi:MAG: hypothetical protein V4692_14745, partial [Bdellovibrionota bacterium]